MVFVWMMRRPLLASLVTDLSRFSRMLMQSSRFPAPSFVGVTILQGGKSELDARIPVEPKNFEAEAAVAVPVPMELFWLILFCAAAFLRALIDGIV